MSQKDHLTPGEHGLSTLKERLNISNSGDLPTKTVRMSCTVLVTAEYEEMLTVPAIFDDTDLAELALVTTNHIQLDHLQGEHAELLFKNSKATAV